MNNSNKKNVIAIIEDDQILSKSLSGELIDAGFDVICAFNGKDGLDLILKSKPDLVLLDIIMPVMDGLTMLRSLREDSWGKRVPVIMLTNLSTDEYLMESALKLDPSHYLTKTDWKLADVVEKVKNIITQNN